MDSWHIWLIVGILLLTLEMLTPGFFVALTGCAALLAGLGAWLGLPFVWQCAVFVASSAFFLAIVRPMVRTFFYRRSDAQRTNVEALIGKTGIVTAGGTGLSSPAQVKIGSEVWRAVTANDAPLTSGARVTVTRIDGSTLTVQESP